MNKNTRLAIYAAVVVVMFALLILGHVDQVQVDQALQTAGMLLGLSGAGLALFNLTPDEPKPTAAPEPTNNYPDKAPWLTEGS